MYKSLVGRIANVPVLQRNVDNMVRNADSLNLVVSEWENALTSCSTYENHKSKKVSFSKGKVNGNSVEVRHVIGLENVFNVVVAGVWSFDTSQENVNQCNGFVCRFSPPLSKIGEVMGGSESRILNDSCRFFVDRCMPGGCHVCRPEKMKTGFVQDDDWCIQNTKIFDGRHLFTASKNNIMCALGRGTFGGVLSVKVYTRITYGQNYKLSGTCYDMILFKETALNAPLDGLEMYYPPISEAPNDGSDRAITFLKD